MQNDDYLEVDNQSRQWGGNLRLNYSFSDAASLALGYSSSELEHEGDEPERNFELGVLSAEYSYTFISDVSIRLRVTDEKRSSEDPVDEYRERYIGAGVRYRF
jgi:predicted porin